MVGETKLLSQYEASIAKEMKETNLVWRKDALLEIASEMVKDGFINEATILYKSIADLIWNMEVKGHDGKKVSKVERIGFSHAVIFELANTSIKSESVAFLGVALELSARIDCATRHTTYYTPTATLEVRIAAAARIARGMANIGMTSKADELFEKAVRILDQMVANKMDCGEFTSAWRDHLVANMAQSGRTDEEKLHFLTWSLGIAEKMFGEMLGESTMGEITESSVLTGIKEKIAELKKAKLELPSAKEIADKKPILEKSAKPTLTSGASVQPKKGGPVPRPLL